MRFTIAASVTLVVCWLPAAWAEPAPRRPNLILILADDLGYETIGANGGTSYATPMLDRLAAGGVRFEHCYVQPLCTPTRVQLLTGLSNVRNYVGFGVMDPAATTSRPAPALRIRRPLPVAAHAPAAPLRQPGLGGGRQAD